MVGGSEARYTDGVRLALGGNRICMGGRCFLIGVADRGRILAQVRLALPRATGIGGARVRWMETRRGGDALGDPGRGAWGGDGTNDAVGGELSEHSGIERGRKYIVPVIRGKRRHS